MTEDADPYLTAARLIRSTHVLSLGTFGPEGAFVGPLPFSVEPDFALLIQLSNDSQHCLNLRINPAVAGAIFDPERSPSHADSIQFTGSAMMMPFDQVGAALERYYRQALPSDGDRIRWTRNPADFTGAAPQRFFRIVLRGAFKLDLESTDVDRRVTLDVGHLKQIYGGLTP